MRESRVGFRRVRVLAIDDQPGDDAAPAEGHLTEEGERGSVAVLLRGQKRALLVERESDAVRAISIRPRSLATVSRMRTGSPAPRPSFRAAARARSLLPGGDARIARQLSNEPVAVTQQ